MYLHIRKVPLKSLTHKQKEKKKKYKNKNQRQHEKKLQELILMALKVLINCCTVNFDFI